MQEMQALFKSLIHSRLLWHVVKKMHCKSCKEFSKLAYLATHLHETYTAKPTDKQIVK